LRQEPATSLDRSSTPRERADVSVPARIAFNVRETAQMLGICEKSVRRLILRGLLKPSRALRHLMIPKQEIERFLRETMSR
jgi:hypothetical protein